MLPGIFVAVPNSPPAFRYVSGLGRGSRFAEYLTDHWWANYAFSAAVWLLGIGLGVWTFRVLVRLSDPLARLDWLQGGLERFVRGVARLSRLVVGGIARLGVMFGAGAIWLDDRLRGLLGYPRPLPPQSYRPRPVDSCDRAAPDGGGDCPPAGCPAGRVVPSSGLDGCLADRSRLEGIRNLLILFALLYGFFMINVPGTGWDPYDLASPSVIVALTLALIAVITTFIDSFWTQLSRAEGGFWVGKLGLTLILLGWIWLFNSDALFPYKQRFEGMAGYYDAPIPLRATIFREYEPGRYPKQQAPLRTCEEEARAEAPLLSDAAVRRAWLERLGGSCEDPEAGAKPKLVVVSVSGGGLRSAYWTAVVLRRLHQLLGDEFDDRVRIITGASGGMLGASCYVEHRYRDQMHPELPGADPDCEHRPDRQDDDGDPKCWVPMVNNIDVGASDEDSLNDLVRFAALREVPMAFLPRAAYSWLGGRHELDRGTVLERSWNLLAAPERGGEDPGRRFSDYRPLEGTGALPSLIVSPMMVEDGRLLLISNLDLRDSGDDCDGGDNPTGKRDLRLATRRRHDLGPGDLDGVRYSLYGLEFFRLFPGALDTFQVRTAVRMNASFPFASPAVNLPTDPPRRVVDAGYFDNYGIKVAAAWLQMNRDWLIEHTSGVLLVQIRDSSSLLDRFEVDDAPDSLGERILGGFQFLTSPLDAAGRARYTKVAFANDHLVNLLSDEYAEMTGDPAFFTTVVFENTAAVSRAGVVVGEPAPDDSADVSDRHDVSMSWYLTYNERQAIERAIPLDIEKDQATDRLRQLASLWDDAAKQQGNRRRETLRRNLLRSEPPEPATPPHLVGPAEGRPDRLPAPLPGRRGRINHRDPLRPERPPAVSPPAPPAGRAARRRPGRCRGSASATRRRGWRRRRRLRAARRPARSGCRSR